MAKPIVVGFCALALSTSAGALVSDFMVQSIKPRPRIDYSLGIVYYETRLDTTLVSLSTITTFDDYLVRENRTAIKKLLQENARQMLRQQTAATGGKGLIPDIGIPVNLPVFGEGSKIDIGGSDEITFGGRNTFLSGAVAQDFNQRPSFLPELRMSQKLKVNLDGSIGNRMHILIDHDTERETDANNRIQLKYKGDPDDILQKVEMGDTQLDIPVTGYIGTLPTHKGLFGISAKAKLAGLDLYTIASREQGAGASAQFTGTTQVNVDTIYDSDFMRRKFYYLPAPPGAAYDLQVYIDDQNRTQLAGKKPGVAFLNPNNTADTSEYTKGLFLLKQPGLDYVFDNRSNIIQLNSTLMDRNILAVLYKVKDGADVGNTRYHDSDTLLLQLLSPQYSDTLSRCWNLELKNYYSVGIQDSVLKNVAITRNDNFKPTVEDSGANLGRPFSVILGVDPDSNGILEFPQLQQGFIIFPVTIVPNPATGWPDTVIYPFASAALSKPDPVIYRRTYLKEGEGKEYFIVAQSSQSKPSFDLGWDLTEGSERVLLNGVLQQKNTDYTIDYGQGIVTFLKKVPANASVQISYEHTPLFSLSQKSVVGTRAELTFLEKGKLGYSVFYRSEGMPGERPTLGSEPYKRVLNELDLSYSADLPGVTRLLDRLPVVRTEAPSSFAFSADGALSLPDPNSMGATYLDDFEGSSIGGSTAISQDMGIEYWKWHPASVPIGKTDQSFAITPLRWWNPAGQIKKSDIYLNPTPEEAKSFVNFMKVAYVPDNGQSWAGLMTGIPTGIDLTDFENIEAVMKTSSTRGRLHISYGTHINEDAPRRTGAGTVVGLNGRQDTEDKNLNGQLEQTEDVGLDTVKGTDGTNVPGDDGNDDWTSDSLRCSGTENNRRLDDEDLNRDGWNTQNDYFEVTINLDSSDYFHDLKNGWRLLRIPINDTSRLATVGLPKKAYINLVRVWFDDFTAPETLQLVSLGFTGSKWKNLGVSPIPERYSLPVDSTEKVEVSTVNKNTNSLYTSPFKPVTDPVTGQLQTESSLQLKYTALRRHHRAVIQRNTFQREDYRQYRRLKIYLHNDQNDPTFFLRLGADTNNYYEYHNTISAGAKVAPYGDGKWFEFTINLDSLPFLKLNPVSSPLFSVHGAPTLAEVGYLALGFENRTDRPFDAGAIWIDDIRLTDPYRNPGAGAQTRVSLNIADIGSANFNYQYTDPNFESFNAPRGVKTGGFSHQYGLTSTVNWNKVLPPGLQLSIPFSYSLNRSRTTPKFSPFANDLLLDRQTAARSLSTVNGENMNIAVSKGKSRFKLLNYSVEALSFSYLRSRAFNQTPLTIDSTQSNSAGVQYSITPSLRYKSVSFFPQSIGLSLSRAATLGRTLSRFNPDSNFVQSRNERTLGATGGMNVRFDPFRLLTTNYSFNHTRNLLRPQLLQGVNIGREQGRSQNTGAVLSYPLNTVLTQPSLSWQATYAATQPLNPDSASRNNRSINNTGSATLRFGLEPLQLLRIIAKPKPAKRDTAAPKPPPDPKPGTIDRLTRMVQPFSVTASHSQASGYLGVTETPDWRYQFGLTTAIPDSSTATNSSQSTDKLDITSGASIGDLSLTAGINRSISNNTSFQTTTRNTSLTWPNLNLTLGRLDRFFKKLAVTSSITSSYSSSSNSTSIPDQTATQTTTRARTFSPLVAWRTTWQRRIQTDISASYSTTEVNITSTSVSRSTDKRGSVTVGYAFSAPRGIQLPGLKRIHFSSDLGLQLTVAYSRVNSTLDYQSKTTPQRNDENIDSQLSATYDFSQSIQGGLRLGYTIYNNRVTDLRSRTPDINFSVKFIF